ncbi:LmbE family protein [Chloroherpeton thalassium ATCC 35110]|uniref:LmbE family protein n=1 Tax=Chloroherpeton thalassium (strain ATCC 35110 / GB-78) TaxID=517418 RepID=B3QVK3_CHLT3|nr:PIG-L deacetylase family protein [Chloroherpeton thalassium]ACF14603.1 LmbE family protein [Chloroherpeton thalassium ATCC 35110]
MVIAPHADDEVLGCGATIAKHTKSGDDVVVVIATDASKGAPEIYNKKAIAEVRSEALNAHKTLGISKTHFFDFPAPALSVYPSYKIAIKFTEIFNDYKPEVIYLPHPGDIHSDHKAIYIAGLVAARPQGIHKITAVYCYETMSETEWAPIQGDNGFQPNHFIDVTDVFQTKIDAMNCFKSQIRDFPHSRSLKALDALATYRGVTVGVEKAEAFEVERQILL